MSSDPERQACFVDLLHARQGVVRKVAALYAVDRAEREDLLQEIALALWRSFETYRGEAAFSTFLYRVALNTALMRVRRRYRRPEGQLERDRASAVEQVAAPEPTRDEEQVERLYAAIRELAPLDRAIVMLVLDERSYAEIAEVTGLSAGNVSVRLVRAKERLRKRLGAARAEEGESCSTKS